MNVNPREPSTTKHLTTQGICFGRKSKSELDRSSIITGGRKIEVDDSHRLAQLTATLPVTQRFGCRDDRLSPNLARVPGKRDLFRTPALEMDGVEKEGRGSS